MRSCQPRVGFGGSPKQVSLTFNLRFNLPPHRRSLPTRRSPATAGRRRLCWMRCALVGLLSQLFFRHCTKSVKVCGENAKKCLWGLRSFFFQTSLSLWFPSAFFPPLPCSGEDEGEGARIP